EEPDRLVAGQLGRVDQREAVLAARNLEAADRVVVYDPEVTGAGTTRVAATATVLGSRGRDEAEVRTGAGPEDPVVAVLAEDPGAAQLAVPVLQELLEELGRAGAGELRSVQHGHVV